MSTPGVTPQASHETLGALVHHLTEQVPALVRSEVRLAQAELADKGKRAGVGAGVLGAAGVLALFGLGALVTAAILALALVLPAWASALVVAAVLFVAAGVAAVVGRARVRAAIPAKPELAIDGVRRDLAVMKGGKP
jgi:uncharacterized membrane protein YqjE